VSSTNDKSKRPVTVDKPLDWYSTLHLSEQAKTIRFVTDEDGNIWGYPVVLVDPQATGDKIQSQGKVVIRDDISGFNATVVLPALSIDGTYALNTNSLQYVYNNVTNKAEIQRTPTVFKTIRGKTTGTNTLWDPAAGKKFRLMGGIITLSKDAACAGAETLFLVDNATDLMAFDISSAALVATGKIHTIAFQLPGNGYLSLAADNILNLSFNAALTAGSASANVWGTEE